MQTFQEFDSKPVPSTDRARHLALVVPIVPRLPLLKGQTTTAMLRERLSTVAGFSENLVSARVELASQLADSGAPRTLQVLRISKGLSQAALAERIGSKQGKLSLLENGRTPDPHIRTLVDLAAALGVSLQEAFDALEKSIELAR